jgi:hypothetical protein
VILPSGWSSLSTAVRPDQPRAASTEGRVMAPPQRPCLVLNEMLYRY